MAAIAISISSRLRLQAESVARGRAGGVWVSWTCCGELDVSQGGRRGSLRHIHVSHTAPAQAGSLLQCWALTPPGGRPQRGSSQQAAAQCTINAAHKPYALSVARQPAPPVPPQPRTHPLVSTTQRPTKATQAKQTAAKKV